MGASAQRSPVRSVELNADLGEGFGVYPQPAQVWRAELLRGGPVDPAPGSPLCPTERVMEMISTVNLACGFHAGDPLLISRYVRAALAAGCTIGAHPSYPDAAGFGNRFMELEHDDLKAVVQYQLGALEGFLRPHGVGLHHVKCHGALYNRSMEDPMIAASVAEAVADYQEDLTIFGLPGSEMEEAATRTGVPFTREGFSDRAYHSNGFLVDRRRDGAMILDAAEVSARVVCMITQGTVRSLEGDEVALDVDTISFHADSPGVLSFLECTIEALAARDIVVRRARQPEARMNSGRLSGVSS